MRGGYLEGQVGYHSASGPYVRGEVGYRPLENLSLFGFAQSNFREAWGGLGVGLKF